MNNERGCSFRRTPIVAAMTVLATGGTLAPKESPTDGNAVGLSMPFTLRSHS